MYFAAKSLQGELIESHRQRGGAMTSTWWTAGIGLLTLVILLAIILQS
jgi:hypothetical protein